jgi:hypothetical protein
MVYFFVDYNEVVKKNEMKFICITTEIYSGYFFKCEEKNNLHYNAYV